MATSESPLLAGNDPAVGYAGDRYAFEEFRLWPTSRVLIRDDVPVQLGARALDILIALVERAGQVVSKEELFSVVWPNRFIEESNLRVHIAAVRKALGGGRSGTRLIASVPGRGYTFVGEVVHTPRQGGKGELPGPSVLGGGDSLVAPLAQTHPSAPSTRQRTAIEPERRLPPRPTGMIGREDVVQSISHDVQKHRFVTITGPGGIGKTTVAVSIAHTLSNEFLGAVYFVDLASVSDPALVPGSLISVLGGGIQSSDPLTGLLAFLRDKRALLLLDNCEHVIEAAASAAERIFKEAGEVCIIATSREPLRVEGERVNRLFPLACPSPEAELTIADSLKFSAIRLFVERASAADNLFEVSDDDVPTVARICRMLDGIALAIELAASQVSIYGVQGLADLIDGRLGFLTQGRRTAPPRHQTLQALLDWSYDLLSPLEQKVLCGLSRFSARFTLSAAKAVAAEENTDLAPIAAVLSSLVSKSLIAHEAVGKGIRYRLLDTTREYASAKLKAKADPNLIARRHALYLSELLESENITPHSEEERWLIFSEYLGDVRAALEWSFSACGDASIAKALVQRAVPLFHELSLLSECNRWAEQALALLRDEDRGTPSEMELHAALAVSLMFTKGNSEEVRLAFVRALALAERLNDSRYELRLNGGLHMFSLRTGDFHGALRYAQRCATIAEKIADGVSVDIADALLSVSHHLAGNQSLALRHCESALSSSALHRRSHAIHFGFDLANRARIALSRLLWLRGLPDQAVTMAQASIREAAELEHPVTLCIALIWTLPVFFWVGNVNIAQQNVEWFVKLYERHKLAAYHGVGLGLRGQLAIERGDADRGTKLLRESLAAMRISRYGHITTPFTSSLVEGLALSDRADEARELIDSQIGQIQESGELFYMPDLLRIKGDIQAARLPDHDASAEETLLQSLDWARRQSALSWELRTAISLARLYYSKGKPTKALSLLRPIYDRFSEGLSTTDLVRARRLLAQCT